MIFRSRKGAQCRQAATTGLGAVRDLTVGTSGSRTFGLNIFLLKALAPARSLPDSERCQGCAKSPQLDCRGFGWYASGSPDCIRGSQLFSSQSPEAANRYARAGAVGVCPWRCPQSGSCRAFMGPVQQAIIVLRSNCERFLPRFGVKSIRSFSRRPRISIGAGRVGCGCVLLLEAGIGRSSIGHTGRLVTRSKTRSRFHEARLSRLEAPT